MKKLIVFGIAVLVILMLLSGCTTQPKEEVAPSIPTPTPTPIIVADSVEEIKPVESPEIPESPEIEVIPVSPTLTFVPIEPPENEVTIITELESDSIKAEVPVEPSPELVEYGATVTFCATAYCPCELCCGKSDGITASGTIATAGRTIAVDPTVIPYGTEVVINGITYVAEDCGGNIEGFRIDIFFDTHEEALEWGVQYVEGVIKKDVSVGRPSGY